MYRKHRGQEPPKVPILITPFVACHTTNDTIEYLITFLLEDILYNINEYNFKP